MDEVAIDGIRLTREDDYTVVSVAKGEHWYKAIKERTESNFDHFVSPDGIRECIDETKKDDGDEEAQRNQCEPSSQELAIEISKPIKFSASTTYQHLFLSNKNEKQHTYTAIGVITLPDHTLVLKHAFAGTDAETLEGMVSLWCQTFCEVLRNTEIRVAKMQSKISEEN